MPSQIKGQRLAAEMGALGLGIENKAVGKVVASPSKAIKREDSVPFAHETAELDVPKSIPKVPGIAEKERSECKVGLRECFILQTASPEATPSGQEAAIVSQPCPWQCKVLAILKSSPSGRQPCAGKRVNPHHRHPRLAQRPAPLSPYF